LSVESLSLANNYISSPNIVFNCPQLIHLDISGNTLAGSFVTELLQYFEKRFFIGMQSLFVSNCGLGAD